MKAWVDGWMDGWRNKRWMDGGWIMKNGMKK